MRISNERVVLQAVYYPRLCRNNLLTYSKFLRFLRVTTTIPTATSESATKAETEYVVRDGQSENVVSPSVSAPGKLTFHRRKRTKPNLLYYGPGTRVPKTVTGLVDAGDHDSMYT